MPQPGGGQPVQRGGPAEHRAGQPPPAAGGLRVEQRLGDPAVVALRERWVEAQRAERVLDQVPAVDRLDLRLHRPRQHGVPDLAGVARGEDDQVLAVRPVGGERVENGEHGGARGDSDRDLLALVLDGELSRRRATGRGAQQQHRVPRVGAAAGEGAPQLQLDDRPVGDELHQSVHDPPGDLELRVRVLVRRLADLASTHAATSLAGTRRRLAALGPSDVGARAATPWTGRFPASERRRRRDRSAETYWRPAGAVLASAPLHEQGDRVLVRLAERSGERDLVLVAARGLAQRGDDAAASASPAAAAASSSRTCQFPGAAARRQPLRAVQVRLVEGVLPGQLGGGEHADGLRVVGGRRQPGQQRR